jgi:hypothetical protein
MSVPTEPRFSAPSWPVLLETLAAAAVSAGWYAVGARWLSLIALVYTVASAIWLWHRVAGRTVLTAAGIRSRRGLRRRHMAWSDLWTIETVTNVRSRYVVVKGDHGRGFQLGGVIESRRRPTPRFESQVVTLSEWATRSGQLYRSQPLTRARHWIFAASLTLLLVGGLTLEQAWYWFPPAQAVTLPDPCGVLDPGVAGELAVTAGREAATVTTVDKAASGPLCAFRSDGLRYVQIGYALFGRTGVRSGTLKAVLAYNAETWQLGLDEVSAPDGGLGGATAPAPVGDDAELQNGLGTYSGLDMIKLVARKANVLIWVSVGFPPHAAGATHYTDAPDPAAVDALLRVARPAIAAIQLS